MEQNVASADCTRPEETGVNLPDDESKQQQQQEVVVAAGGATGNMAATTASPASGEHRTVKTGGKKSKPSAQQPAPVSLLPIGVVRSCFRECRGTPRQGFFAPATRGRIEFDTKLQPDCTLGLEEFSHVWIVFLFHMNNNIKSNKAAQTRRGHSFKTKVKPPKLQGKSVGIFATRTPHRPNAVGLSLAKLDKVDGRTLHISALDLTDGTPVLDVKPYVPVYDSVPEAFCPAWCGERTVHRQNVSFTCEAIDAIDSAAERGRLRFYQRGSDVRRAIQQLLENDVRPDAAYRRYSDHAATTILHFRLDMLKVGYRRLHQVQHSSTSEEVPSKPHVQVCEITVETKKDERAMAQGQVPRYGNKTQGL